MSKTDFPAGVDAPGRAQISTRTLRPDRWWLEPLLTFIGLSSFVLYGGIRTATQSAYFIEGANYSYLSPFASPCVSSSCVEGSSHFGHWFGTFPQMIPLAILTLPFLLGFRLTCYYYRKAYYRSFWLSPPACAVAEPKRKAVAAHATQVQEWQVHLSEEQRMKMLSTEYFHVARGSKPRDDDPLV